MRQRIDLIVTDLDGTFLNSYHELNDENIEAVHLAQKHGIAVCPVTARNFDCARYTIMSTGFDPLCVTNNGAAIIDSRDGSHRFKNFIAPQAVRAIAQEAVAAEASVDIFASEYCVIYGPTARKRNDGWEDAWAQKPSHLQRHQYSYDDLDAMIARVSDCAENITLHGKDLDELPGTLYRRIIEQGEFYLTSSHYMCIDIMAYGSTKWQGVQRLADMLGVRAEHVMSFGDNSNDIGMLTWAGVGVAMGNAPDYVKRAADVVTLPNTQAGFAKMVRELVK